MEKSTYRYQHGYINIDSENIYLTNTGNWSETRKLDEKKSQPSLNSKFRRIRMYFFLLVGITLLGVLFLYNIFSVKLSLSLLVGIPVLIWFFYKYLSAELGLAFKIPINKIKSIEKDYNDICITFLNLNGEEDFVNVNQIKSFDLDSVGEVKIKNNY